MEGIEGEDLLEIVGAGVLRVGRYGDKDHLYKPAAGKTAFSTYAFVTAGGEMANEPDWTQNGLVWADDATKRAESTNR